MNKKGVAEIVLTMTLIAITISAVLFASWSFMNLVTTRGNILESPAFNCLKAQTSSNPVIQIAKACRNSETGDVEVILQRGVTDVYVDALTFAFKDSTWHCSSSCANCEILQAGTTKTYFFAFSSLEEQDKIKLYVNSCELDEKTIGECWWLDHAITNVNNFFPKD